MALTRLSGDQERPITVAEFNKFIEEIGSSIEQGLGEVATRARDGKASITDNSGGTSVNTVAIVPVAYNRAYLQETFATILNRVNGLIAVQRSLARLSQ